MMRGWLVKRTASEEEGSSQWEGVGGSRTSIRMMRGWLVKRRASKEEGSSQRGKGKLVLW